MTGFTKVAKDKKRKGYKKPKSKDKHNKKSHFRGHRLAKYNDRESLLCNIDYDPIVSVVVREKLSLDDLLENLSIVNTFSKVKVKKDLLESLLKEGWEEVKPNFNTEKMIDGSFKCERSMKWAEVVCKCVGMGFCLDTEMTDVAKFIHETKDFKEFIEQWKVYPKAKYLLGKDCWYGINDPIEWKKDHVKPDVIRPWCQLAAKSKDAQTTFFEKFMSTEQRSAFGQQKPFDVGQSITSSYLDNSRECMPCKQCGVENWHSFHVVFDQVTNSSVYSKDQCGVVCRDCMLKELKTRDIDAKTQAHVFHGLSVEPQPFRKCPVKGCTRGCVIQALKNRHWDFFAENLCIEVSKLKEIMEKGIEEEVNRMIAEATAYYQGSYVPDPDKPDDGSKRKTRAKINAISTKINRISDYKKQQKLRNLTNELNKVYYQYELSYQVYLLKTRVAKANELRDAEEWDKMFSQVDNCQSSINSVQSYATYAKTDEMYGMSQRQWVQEWLKGVKAQVQLCVNSADRCGICMTVTASKDSDMLPMHAKGEQSGHNKTIPCKACADCFDNYVNHTSALGKPRLKCPGASCGRMLGVGHVQEIAPASYAKYEAALMRFELKKVQNFKFCPNDHGFLTYENCEASRMSCPTCSINFCPGCGSQPHEDIGDGSCLDNLKHQHKARWAGKTEVETTDKEKEEKKEEEKFFAEAGESSKQCPFCTVWIEKNGGCQHMTCEHCRGEFCWICNGKWRGHTTCDAPIKIGRPYFHEIYPKTYLEDEEEEFFSSDSEVNSECSEAYGRFLGTFRKAWEPPGPEQHNKDYGHNEYMEDVYYQQYLQGMRNDSSDDSSDEGYETDSECFVHDFAAEIRYFNFIEQFNCEDKWEPPKIHYGNTYKNFLHGFKTYHSDSDSDSDTNSLIVMDYNTDTIPAFLFPNNDSDFEFPPGQNMFPNSDTEEEESSEVEIEIELEVEI